MPRVALLATPILLGAIFTVHGATGFFSNPHGGSEYPACWIVALVVQALLGDGAYALRVLAVNAAARSATARATAAVEAKKIGGACAPPTTTGPTVDGGNLARWTSPRF